MVKAHRDWDALRMEFLQSKETLNQFKIRHQIKNSQWFYKKARAWNQERANLVSNAQKKVIKHAERELAENWKGYIDLLGGLKAQIAKIISDSLDADGRVIQPIEPSQLKDIAHTIEKALKSEKLVLGEPTEITEDKSETKHVQVVQVLQMLNTGKLVEE